MTLKSEMCCPTSGQDCKVSVERETERLKQREQRKTTREFKDAMAEGFKSVAKIMEKERLTISTGDYVPPSIWTEEKLEELQKVIDIIKKRRTVKHQVLFRIRWNELYRYSMESN